MMIEDHDLVGKERCPTCHGEQYEDCDACDGTGTMEGFDRKASALDTPSVDDD